MSSGEAKTDREQVAAELQRVREEVRARALHETGEARLPGPVPPRTPVPMPPLREPDEAEAPPPRPDNAPLNSLWAIRPSLGGGGVRSWLGRLVGPGLLRLAGAQEAFNSRQVQFDNELLAYVDARIDAVHRQYDAVLGVHRRHMAEIDERHLILQEELVAHVHDLVKRVDLVLELSERGRLGLERELQDLRARLQRLEERLARE